MNQKLAIFLFVLIGMTSCKKDFDSFSKDESVNQTSKINFDRFFPSEQGRKPIFDKIFTYLQQENDKKEFLSDFVKTAGYPRWDKTIFKKPSFIENTNLPTNTSFTSSDTLCLIPLVTENNTAITGVLVAAIQNGQVECHFALSSRYNDMGALKREFVISLIQLEKHVYGRTSFKIHDSLLLGNAHSMSLRKRQQSNGGRTETLDDPCTIVEIWYDPTAEECHCSGDEYYTGEWYYEGDCSSGPNLSLGVFEIFNSGGGGTQTLPGGGGNNGGGNGGNGDMPPAYSSTFTERLNYLQSQLSLTTEASDILSNNEAAVNEMYLYVNSNPTAERKAIAAEHIQRLATDQDYVAFVNNYQTSSGNSNDPWWENDIWLDNASNFNLDITRATNQYDKLTAAEKALVAIYPIQAYIIKQNVQPAFNMSDSRMGASGGLNDKKDAFRHAFFQAINTRDVPGRVLPVSITGSAIVTLFATAHESEVPQQLQLEKQMDLFNNGVGISYCWNCWTISNSSIADAIMNKLNNGDLKYIKPLNFTYSPYFDANGDGVQDCPTCLNGILSTSDLTPTNQ